MKKILLSLATLASFGVANAQKMGDVFVYGSVGYTDQKNDVTGLGTVDHNRMFNFAPGIGYQFNRNWAVGLSGDMMATKNTSYSSTTSGKIGTVSKYSETYVGPFLRYTQPLSPMFFVFGQLNAQYLRTNQSSVTVGVTALDELEGNGFRVNVMPALGINISRHIAVIGSFGNIGYTNLKANAPTGGVDYRTSRINTTFGSNFTLGVQWNFGAGGRMHRTHREPMGETRRMDRYRDTEADTDKDNDETPTPPPAPRRRRNMDRRMDRRDNRDN